jgi:cell division inhibitor SepF
MSALRKAGVWLGLVEEEDEVYEVDDEFAEDDDFTPPARPRTLSRSTESRTADPRSADRDPRSEYRRAEARGRADADRTAPDRTAADRSAADRTGADRAAADRAAAEREARTATRESLARAETRRLSESRSGQESRLTSESRLIEQRGDREFWGSERPGRESYRDESAYDDPPAERATVRSLPRSIPPPAPVTYPTQDNLALAPQVQLRERAVVPEEKSRRYQITTLHPTTYSEARTIGEHFRNGYPVIMNLTELDEPDAKRLVDFAAGLAFGLRGSMERVTNRVFLLSPPNIQVSAEDKAKIAESGFFDQA